MLNVSADFTAATISAEHGNGLQQTGFWTTLSLLRSHRMAKSGTFQFFPGVNGQNSSRSASIPVVSFAVVMREKPGNEF